MTFKCFYCDRELPMTEYGDKKPATNPTCKLKFDRCKECKSKHDKSN